MQQVPLLDEILTTTQVNENVDRNFKNYWGKIPTIIYRKILNKDYR